MPVNVLLEEALHQADSAIAQSVGTPCPVKSKLSPRGSVANPAPRVLHMDGEAVLSGISLENTWFSSVSCENGFLNFILSQQWLDCAINIPQKAQAFPQLPDAPVHYFAAIHPEDWFFAEKKATPALCARQDEQNAGWLVRVTEERLKTLENRCPAQALWTEQEKQLFLRLCGFDEGMSWGKMTDYLTELARLIWQLHPHRLSRPLNVYAQRILHNGRAVIYRKFTNY